MRGRKGRVRPWQSPATRCPHGPCPLPALRCSILLDAALATQRWPRKWPRGLTATLGRLLSSCNSANPGRLGQLLGTAVSPAEPYKSCKRPPCGALSPEIMPCLGRFSVPLLSPSCLPRHTVLGEVAGGLPRGGPLLIPGEVCLGAGLFIARSRAIPVQRASRGCSWTRPEGASKEKGASLENPSARGPSSLRTSPPRPPQSI